jgi:hypothetical protein
MIFHPRQPATILAQAIEAMAETVIGANPLDRERICAGLYTADGWQFLRDLGNYALGGLDMALYDPRERCRCERPAGWTRARRGAFHVLSLLG